MSNSESAPIPLSILAYRIAARGHAGDKRRNGVTPYIAHIDEVIHRAPLGDVNQAVAALHDLIEEAGFSLPELAYLGMPPEVIRGVDTLTRRPDETYAAFIERVKVTDGGRWVPIKVADILSNLTDEPTESQIVRYAKALLVLLG